MEVKERPFDVDYDQYERPCVPAGTKRIYNYYTMSYKTVTILKPAPRAQDMPHALVVTSFSGALTEVKSNLESATDIIEGWLEAHTQGTVTDIMRGCKLNDTVVRRTLLSDARFVVIEKSVSRNSAQAWGLAE